MQAYNHDLMLGETDRYLYVRRSIFIFQEFLLSGQSTLSNVLKDMLKPDRLNTIVDACNKDAVEVKFPLEEKKVLQRDVFIPTMDPIVGVHIIPGKCFAIMREMSLEVCQYLKHDMNTWPNSIVSIVTMCLSLEATQQGYHCMVYPLIQDINPEDPDEMLDFDDKITKVLRISYIDSHYDFLLIYKVNCSVDIIE